MGKARGRALGGGYDHEIWIDQAAGTAAPTPPAGTRKLGKLGTGKLGMGLFVVWRNAHGQKGNQGNQGRETRDGETRKPGTETRDGLFLALSA